MKTTSFRSNSRVVLLRLRKHKSLFPLVKEISTAGSRKEQVRSKGLKVGQDPGVFRIYQHLHSSPLGVETLPLSEIYQTQVSPSVLSSRFFFFSNPPHSSKSSFWSFIKGLRSFIPTSSVSKVPVVPGIRGTLSLFWDIFTDVYFRTSEPEIWTIKWDQSWKSGFQSPPTLSLESYYFKLPENSSSTTDFTFWKKENGKRLKTHYKPSDTRWLFPVLDLKVVDV